MNLFEALFLPKRYVESINAGMEFRESLENHMINECGLQTSLASQVMKAIQKLLSEMKIKSNIC